ncbi:hypothetical protein [Streptomyces murinus]|uniref:hypothetical protein n=1 Tax=Streptomyces murinus TaxID=33900 RepID=UPI003809610C
MNTRSVNAAAELIQAALRQGRTAAGIALALELESAQLLQSPERAVEFEQMRARVAELELERHSTNEALDDAVQELRARRDAEVVDRSVDKLTQLLAPSQALLEDPHDGPLHHGYRLGRDLPPLGGVS